MRYQDGLYSQVLSRYRQSFGNIPCYQIFKITISCICLKRLTAKTSQNIPIKILWHKEKCWKHLTQVNFEYDICLVTWC